MTLRVTQMVKNEAIRLEISSNRAGDANARNVH
jgi:hypothetical protein